MPFIRRYIFFLGSIYNYCLSFTLWAQCPEIWQIHCPSFFFSLITLIASSYFYKHTKTRWRMFSINTYFPSRTSLLKRKQLRNCQKSMSPPQVTLKSPWFWKVKAGLGSRKCHNTILCYYVDLKISLVADTASLPQVN